MHRDVNVVYCVSPAEVTPVPAACEVVALALKPMLWDVEELLVKPVPVAPTTRVEEVPL